MFRKSALKKHQAAQVVRASSLGALHRKTRTALALLVLILVAATAWGFFGKIPETGRGQAILVTKGSVRAVQAKATGQVVEWFVKVGDEVEEGQQLGVLDQPAIESELQQSQEKLRELEERNRDFGDLREKFSALEKKSFEARAERLRKRLVELKRHIKTSESFAEQVRRQSAEFYQKQSKNLESARAAEAATADALEKRMESFERLRGEGLAAEDRVRTARRGYEDSKLRLKDIALRTKELDVSRLRVDEAYQQARGRIATRQNELAELELELKELDNREAKLDKKQHEAQFTETNEAQELKRRIARYQSRLKRERLIKAPFAGRVLELTAAEGAVVSLGARIMQLDTRQPDDPLVALAFFSPSVAKRLKPGAPIRISPSTANRSVHGRIVGRVRAVSAYPVSAESVSHHIGNQALATQLLAGGHSIEVEVELMESAETASGYRWTSKAGPPLHFTAGTQSEAIATLEWRRPVAHLMSAFRTWISG